MNLKKSLQKLGLKELPPHSNYRIIELNPDKIKYGKPTEGVFRVICNKKE